MVNDDSIDSLLDAVKKAKESSSQFSSDAKASSKKEEEKTDSKNTETSGDSAESEGSQSSNKHSGDDSKTDKKEAATKRQKRDKSTSAGSLLDILFPGMSGDRSESENDSEDDSEGGGRGGKGAAPLFDFNSVPSFSRKKKIGLIVGYIVVLAVLYWWFHPPLNFQSPDFWGAFCIFILLPIFIIAYMKRQQYEHGTEEIAPNVSKAKTFKYISFIPVAFVVVGLIGALTSLAIFPGNAEKYSSLLKTQNLDFASDIEQVDYSQIPVIDKSTAEVLGNKEMGNIPDYVSQFDISSHYAQINYNGTPVRVSPLNYADLFKWLFNRNEGIPAYAMVDMATQNASIVRISGVDKTTGKGMKYTESEPLARNINRYVQLKYPFYMFDEFSFEVDDNGHPWWICPVQSKTIGLFGGWTISRVVICDAVTGECSDMDVSDVPQWVDRVYPANLLIQQYNWYGAFNNGWLNSWLGQSGVVKTTPGSGSKLGYNYIAKDDDVWVYTGVTSATSDNSIVGFVLINQRTAESHFYSVAGATENSAMESAEGQVQQMRYVATFPILINVANQPTYFMALKDQAGLVKQFAMIDIQRYQNVAVGDTVANTQQAYIALLATNGIDTSSADAASATLEASGTISRMAQAVIDGNSHFYVTLNGDSSIYDFPLPGLKGIVAYSQGDRITFKYVDSGSGKVADSIL